MEGIHARFPVQVTSGSEVRDFEVVPSIGHYAILENDETVAEITIGENGLQVENGSLPQDVLKPLINKIQEHEI